MKKKCDACGQMVEVEDGKFVAHKSGEDDCAGTYKADSEADEEEAARVEYEDYSEEQPRAENGEFGEGGGGGGGGEKVSAGEAKARAAFPGPKESAHSPAARTAWYKEQTSKMKTERGGLKKARKSLKGDAARVRRFEHLDLSSELPKPVKTADGFWAVSGHVARTGIQEYRDSAGGIRRELRLPEDVRASLPSFALHPLTNDHPPEMVEPTNAQKYVAGAVGEAKMDGGWVTAPLMIYTAAAIAAVEGGRAQLSVGYSCRLEDADGEWQGQKYDAIQREIVVNHVALVDNARAGTAARLRLDAGDAVADSVALPRDTTPAVTSEKTMEKPMLHELRIDGLVFQVSDPNAQAAYDRALKQRDDALAAATGRVTNADALVATANKDRDTAQAARDNAQSELKSLRDSKIERLSIAVADAVDPTKFGPALQAVVEKAAAERASLLIEARKHLGANEKFDAYIDAKSGKDVPAKSDLEIKRLVVEKLDKDVKLDGKSADYIQARYDGLIETAGKRAAPAAVPIISGTRDDAAPPATEPSDARQRMIARTLAANAKRN